MNLLLRFKIQLLKQQYKTDMNIAFSDFWQYPKAFDPNNNFFIHVIRQLFEGVQVVHPEDADYMIFSSFGNENGRYNNCKKIFYTGENVRPNFNKCDYSLTFDFDTYGGKNFRLPLWYLYIDWFNVGSYGNPDWLIPESYLYGENIRPNFNRCDYSLTFDFDTYGDRNFRLPLWYLYIDWFNVGSYGNPDWLIPESYLYGGNEFTEREKSKFCSIVYGSPHQSRINAVKNISRNYKQVEVFGKANPNYNLPDGENYKMDLISNYKFSLCYENSVTPGYHTEKLLHGKIVGNVPIYYGDKTVSQDFNPDSFINAYGMTDEELVEIIRKIDSDNELYIEIRKQNLFREKINLNEIYNIFQTILS